MSVPIAIFSRAFAAAFEFVKKSRKSNIPLSVRIHFNVYYCYRHIKSMFKYPYHNSIPFHEVLFSVVGRARNHNEFNIFPISTMFGFC